VEAVSVSVKIGFSFVPFPREIWENGWMLTQGEFRLLGWFLSGLQFGIQQRCYTDQELLKGCPNRPPLGLSRNSMKQARDGLANRKILFARQISDGGRGHDAKWEYHLQLSENDNSIVSPRQSECQDLTIQLSKSDTTIKEVESTERAEELLFPASQGGKTSPSKGTRIPETFQVTTEHKKWAMSESFPSPDRYIDEFKDYWKARPGAGGVKLDWDATFRNWIRKAVERNGNGFRRPTETNRMIDVDDYMKQNGL